MYQRALTAPIHPPDGDPTHVPNSTSECEGITRTGGGSWNELPSNIVLREKEYVADVMSDKGPYLAIAEIVLRHICCFSHESCSCIALNQAKLHWNPSLFCVL